MVKFNKIFIFGIFIIISYWSLTLGNTQVKKQYGALLFYYKKEDSLLVRKLVNRIDKHWQKVQSLFHEALQIPVTIIVTKSNKEFNHYLNNQVPEWSQAVALPQQRMVVLKLADAEQIKASPKILIHELVHVLLYDYLKNAYIPVWLNEGMAEFFSEGGLSFEKKLVLAQAIVQKKVIDLMVIDSLLHMPAPKARLAYIEAQSAVQFLVREFGEQKLIDLLKNVRVERNFKKSFWHTYNFDLLDFEIQWNEFIKQRYRWLVLLKLDEWIFALSGILFILVVILVYFRNRRKVRDMEEDDIENFNNGGA